MTIDDEKKSIIMEKPIPPNAKFVEFEIEKEEWDKYKLADGTLVRTRFVLTGILMDKTMDEIRNMLKELAPNQALKIGFGFRAQRLFAVEPPPSLRGAPDSKKYSVEELRDAIVAEDLDFETLKSTWNSYRLKNGMSLKCRLSPTVISRTNKLDDGGIPVYFIDSTLDVKVNMPTDIERLLERKKSLDKPIVR